MYLSSSSTAVCHLLVVGLFLSLLLNYDFHIPHPKLERLKRVGLLK